MSKSHPEACSVIERHDQTVDVSRETHTRRNCKRRRAKQACLACRARKVRCDVSLSGAPCMNCRLDSEDCVIKPRTYKWRFLSRGQRNQNAPTLSHNKQPTAESPSCRSEERPDMVYESTTLGFAQESLELMTRNQIIEPAHTHTAESSEGEQNEWVCEPDLIPEVSCHAFRELSRDRRHSQTLSGPRLTPLLAPASMSVLFPVYHFLKLGNCREIDADTAKFMEQKGCLHLPTRPVLDQFIQCYFLYFHPLVPLLNEQRIWDAYNDYDPRYNGYLSLFILQAMLFVSCPFVSLETLNSIGFKSVKEARAEFYSRSKTLFDLQIGLNDQARAQGALMLTYCTITSSDKDAIYWLSIAIHYAKRCKAYLYNENNMPENNCLKRLWWCCVLRDQILALAYHKLPLIGSNEFDFSLPGLTLSDFADEIGSSQVYNVSTKPITVQVAIMLCDLGVILHDVHLLSYLSTQQGIDRQETQNIILELDTWYEETHARFRLPTLIAGAQESIMLFSNIMYTYHYAAKAVLHNCTLLSTASPGYDSQFDQESTRIGACIGLDRCFHGITKSLTELEHHSLVRYLPVTLINFAAMPFLWNLLQSQILSLEDRTLYMQQELKVQTDVIKGFSDLYETTESIIKRVHDIVEHIKSNELPLAPDAGHFEKEVATSACVRRKNAWEAMAIKDPHKYVRIALTIQFSLTRGYYPSEEDFPQNLRAINQGPRLGSLSLDQEAELPNWDVLLEALDRGLFSETFSVTDYMPNDGKAI